MQLRQPADLLIEARWVLPIAPRNIALAEHAVAIAAGRILALGPAAELRERFEAREHVVREGHALLPGLVNAHTHAAGVLLRSAPAAAPSDRIADAARELRTEPPDADLVREGSRIAIAQMLRAGITCIASTGPHPEETARVAAAARMHAAVGLPVTDRPQPGGEGAGSQLARAESLWDEYRSSPWVSLYFSPAAGDAMSDATLTRLRTVADELDARIAMALAGAGDGAATRALRRAHALGLLRPGFAALGLRAEAEDLELAARTGIAAIACPQAELRAGRGAAQVRELRARGVPVGLGTGDPSAGALDLLAEARTTALLGPLGAPAALELATLGGASVLGLAGLIGSIEPGKAADLIAVDLAALSCQSSGEPAESLVFSATREHVSDVWLSGSAAVTQGRLLAFDAEELQGLRERWHERLRQPWSGLPSRAQARPETRP